MTGPLIPGPLGAITFPGMRVSARFGSCASVVEIGPSILQRVGVVVTVLFGTASSLLFGAAPRTLLLFGVSAMPLGRPVPVLFSV